MSSSSLSRPSLRSVWARAVPLAFLLTVLLGASASAQFGSEARTERYASNAKAMLEWMHEASSISTDAASAIDSEILGRIAGFMTDPESDPGEYAATADALATSCDTKLSAASARHAALEKPRRWKISGESADMERKLQSTATLFHETLPDTITQIQAVCDDFIGMMRNLAAGNQEADYNAVVARMQSVARVLIRDENAVLTGMIEVLEDDTPNHWFHKIMRDGNTIVLREMDIVAAYLEMGDTEGYLEERRRRGRAMQAALKSRPALLSQGRATIDMAREKFDTLMQEAAGTPFEPMVVGARAVIDTYPAVFDLEDEIFALELENARLYASADPDEVIDPQVAVNDAQYLRLTEQRARLQLQRTATVAGLQ